MLGLLKGTWDKMVDYLIDIIERDIQQIWVKENWSNCKVQELEPCWNFVV